MTGCSKTADAHTAADYPEGIIGDSADNEVIINERISLTFTVTKKPVLRAAGDGEKEKKNLKERHDKWWKENGDKCNGAINLINNCLIKQKFDFKEITGAIADLLGVGSAVKAFLKFIPDAEPTDPAIILLNSLKNQVQALSDQVNARFDDLKAFITEMNFEENIAHPLESLRRFMTDCLQHPTSEANENFEKFYNCNDPLKIAYHLLDQFEKDTTNPLKRAMDADPMKSRATFDKWQNTIDSIFGKLLLVEAFGSGLLKDGNKFNANLLIQRSDDILEKMEKWKREYTENGSYWLGMTAFLRQYQSENAHLSLKQKADDLRDKLNTIMTRDAFYLIVYKESYSNADFGISTPYPTHLIQSNNIGGCCVILYRSTDAHYVDISELKQVEIDVKKCFRDRLQSRNDYSDYPRMFYSNPITNGGLILFIRRLDEQIRWANCPRRDYGPGWYEVCATYLQEFFNVRCHDITMLVGYP